MSDPRKIRVVVYHGEYGCDTGCCGHYVEFPEHPGRGDVFGFDHPYTDDPAERRAWAVEYAQEQVTHEFGADHVADLDWDNCEVRDW